MKALWPVLRLVWRAHPGALLRGGLLGVATLAAGAGLLALSGWFITAAGLAGLAGLGMVFDVFRPSAGVRLLALGRTAARYGERLMTHDATLRALAALRVDLLARLARADLPVLAGLRGAAALNRLTDDVDALDGVALRLALPVAGAVLTLALGWGGLWLWMGPVYAAWIAGGYAVGGALVLMLAARGADRPARRAEIARRGLRRAAIDLLRGRRELILYGRLEDQRARVLALDRAERAALRARDRAERAGAFGLSVLVTLAIAAALVLGQGEAGARGPAMAALGLFLTLGLGEALQPALRGMVEFGRMRDAARRVGAGAPSISSAGSAVTAAQPSGAQLSPPPALPLPVGEGVAVAGATPADQRPILQLRGLGYRREGAQRLLFDGIDLDLHRGAFLAVAGPSGAGKSTLLHCIAGLLPASEGTVVLEGRSAGHWDEAAFRRMLAMLPQRSALIAGTVAENLALADDAIPPEALRAALETVDLTEALRGRGGLAARLGEGGAGLSGGQARRLALARVLLRRPAVLLLDEPTEGLDAATARRVMAGIRISLPGCAILMASHHGPSLDQADRILRLP